MVNWYKQIEEIMDIFNGCKSDFVKEVYNMFSTSPFVTGYCARIVDGTEEIVFSIDHYKDNFDITFKEDIKIGEIELVTNFGDEWYYEPYGKITVQGLKDLLDSLPHIKSFML